MKERCGCTIFLTQNRRMGQQVVSYCLVKSCWWLMTKMWVLFFSHEFIVFDSELILFKCYFDDLNKFPKMKSKKIPAGFPVHLRLLSLPSWQNCVFYTGYLSHPPVIFVCMFSVSAHAGNACLHAAGNTRSWSFPFSLKQQQYAECQFTILGFKLGPP